ncbi:nucleotidyltransferase [Gordonia phage Syleon]|uniref:Nucleotidyltransferase n=1 Tax=Gordonia phage Syleon TaxID=2653718 RepID=A0A5Q2WG35_9CAUD|nr:nucleotidyltransferase [Gordonia phage Syleon]QGH75824.1 nucleotidyltransferase [Gordonia phage Syleon]
MLGVAGSQLYGTQLDNGDNDQMGVAIEPPSHVIGLSQFEQWQYHSAGNGVRSGSEDLDVTVYSLRKWTRLAEQGNPTVLLLGFTPDELLLKDSFWGMQLRANMDMFISQQAGSRFLGYLDSQRKQMLGLTGRKHSNRPELVEQYGYDTKFAYHAVRLGMQGVEYLTTGHMELPMNQEYRDYLIDIRQGRESKEDVVTVINLYIDLLRKLKHSPDLPPRANRVEIDAWLEVMYETFWSSQGRTLPHVA